MDEPATIASVIGCQVSGRRRSRGGAGGQTRSLASYLDRGGQARDERGRVISARHKDAVQRLDELKGQGQALLAAAALAQAEALILQI
ncbi:hypothetical protein [Streptomyces sp. NPDC046985]|uniref:hypothetical protein n=1 Tax=Streptomyces sp. NPDC046985 TaxID=3155377 RepID=UPI0033E4F72D